MNIVKTNRKINKIIIHCSASKEGVDIGVKEIDVLHKKRGFKEIGYHYVIRINGVIEIGRDINKIGAHTAGFNTGSIGVCYVGGLDKNGKPKDTRTVKQKNSLYVLLCKLMMMYDIKEVKGHRDYSPDINGDGKISKYEWIKSCPCFEVSDFLSEYNLDKLLKK